MSTRTKVIGTGQGLCNRLRILSNWYGRVDHIRMLWPVNYACPAFWTDMFEPISKVNFVESSERQANRYKPKIGQERYLTLHDLKPVINVPKIEEPYTAVHIRRTDLVKVQRKRGIPVRSEENFIEEVEKTGIDLVYLATDNAKTQNIFRRHFKERLFYYDHIVTYGSNYKPYRCTTMEHAIYDLYTCLNATHFIPTALSSFSGTINAARQIKKNNT